MKHILIATEGNHDQAVIAKILTVLGFIEFRGSERELEPFWTPLIPKQSLQNNLYQRILVPSFLKNDTFSIAVMCGEGSNLSQNILARLNTNPNIRRNLHSIGVIVDADSNDYAKLGRYWKTAMSGIFADFPSTHDQISTSNPKCGLYIIPGDSSGTIEKILNKCGQLAYSELLASAETHVNVASPHMKAVWKPYDREKALISSVISVIRPSKASTSSYKEDMWITQTTITQVPELKKLVDFLQRLIS